MKIRQTFQKSGIHFVKMTQIVRIVCKHSFQIKTSRSSAIIEAGRLNFILLEFATPSILQNTFSNSFECTELTAFLNTVEVNGPEGFTTEDLSRLEMLGIVIGETAAAPAPDVRREPTSNVSTFTTDPLELTELLRAST